jgi:hypothetical protein
MTLNALEQSSDWMATVEYEGSRDLQTLCLLHDRFTTLGFFWLIPDFHGEWPWDAVRNFDPVATARLPPAWPRQASSVWSKGTGPSACPFKVLVYRDCNL